MNEYDVSLRLKHVFESHGYDARKTQDAIICPRCRCKIVPERGLPDRTMIHPAGRACYVEVKVLRRNETSFSFSEISDEQRIKLDDWRDRGGIGYLGLGIIRRLKKNDRLCGLYLIEWSRWVNLEKQVRPLQDSIPFRAGKGFAVELQKRALDIERQLWPWALRQITGGWAIPGDHPAMKQLSLSPL